MNAKPDFPKITSTELDLIGKIGKRARGMTMSFIKRPQSAWVMDVDACHRSCPLKLAELLAADDFNFMHDVIGIMKHLNRMTGKLEDCFLPRFAKSDDDLASEAEEKALKEIDDRLRDMRENPDKYFEPDDPRRAW